jgi:methylase of polypeptide subunit release factors
VSPANFAGTGVLADEAAMAALRRLAGRLRAAGYDNRVTDSAEPGCRSASRLALGHPVERHELDEADAAALVRVGAADIEGDFFAPRFTLFALGDVLVLIPRDEATGAGRVYFGRDSLLLAEMASRLAGPGGALADLGTGAGTVAALLAPRFDVVVATEILPRTAACAAITFALNPRPGGRPAATACLSDVAAGLVPGTFSLVTGNPPWVPDVGRGGPGPARVFAEGGATGFEVPRRFIVEGAALLAPQGVMVMLALDAKWENGERPLRSLARGLVRLGFDARMEVTGVADAGKGGQWDLARAYPSLREAEHVALVVRRTG